MNINGFNPIVVENKRHQEHITNHIMKREWVLVIEDGMIYIRTNEEYISDASLKVGLFMISRKEIVEHIISMHNNYVQLTESIER